jgi:hypothetical protein
VHDAIIAHDIPCEPLAVHSPLHTDALAHQVLYRLWGQGVGVGGSRCSNSSSVSKETAAAAAAVISAGDVG